MREGPEDRPVNGNLQKIVEELLYQHRSCEIVYRAADGGRVVIRDRIIRLYEKKGAAEMETAGGLTIALAQLIGIDGKTPDPPIHSC